MSTAPADNFRRAGSASEPRPVRDPATRRPAARPAGRQEDRDDRRHRLHRRAVAVEDPHRAARTPSRRCWSAASGSAGARDRVVALVKKPIFAAVREAYGGAEELVDARIEVIEGDLPGVPELPADLDVVVHCAGDVSFDPPIDQAFTTNVIGTKALMDRILQAVTDDDGTRSRCRTTCTSPPRTPPAGAGARSRRLRMSTTSTTTPRPRPGWPCGT